MVCEAEARRDRMAHPRLGLSHARQQARVPRLGRRPTRPDRDQENGIANPEGTNAIIDVAAHKARSGVRARATIMIPLGLGPERGHENHPLCGGEGPFRWRPVPSHVRPPGPPPLRPKRSNSCAALPPVKSARAASGGDFRSGLTAATRGASEIPGSGRRNALRWNKETGALQSALLTQSLIQGRGGRELRGIRISNVA